MGAAGWHICFDVLDRLLGGAPIGRIVGPDAMKFGGWQRLNAEYAKQFGVETLQLVLWRADLNMPRSNGTGRRLLDRHRALLAADRLHRQRAAAPAAGGGRRSPTSASPPTSGWSNLVGQAPSAWGWAAATGVLWGLSYFFWRRAEATPASA